MEKRVFNINTDELGADLTNYISYVYAVYMPSGENTLERLQKPVSPWHKGFTKIIGANSGILSKSPYEIINEQVTEDISKFYSEISDKIYNLLSGFDERADRFRNQFRADFEKATQTTIKRIMNVLESCAVTQADLKEVIKRISEVIEKRRTDLQELLESIYLQITRCIVLWGYEDNGFTEYMLTTFGENCGVCTSMAGQRLLIKDIVPYENFPPLHPHCDCTVIILGKNGGVERVLDSEGRFIDEETGDLLEYANAVLKKAVLGDFSDEEYTPDALALSVAVGILGADLPMDVRDLAASIVDINQNGINEERRNTLILNLLAVAPVAGVVKYADDAAGIAKYGDDIAEGVEVVAEHGDEVGDVVEGNIKSNIIKFPSDPADFNPKGLTKIGPFETKNGKIIKWIDENKKAVFEWDEDLKYGSHYHVIGDDGNTRLPNNSGETHFLPGDIFEGYERK